jgi:hypothetical protein
VTADTPGIAFDIEGPAPSRQDLAARLASLEAYESWLRLRARWFIPASFAGAAALAALLTWALPPPADAGWGARSFFMAAFFLCAFVLPAGAAFSRVTPPVETVWLAVAVSTLPTLGFAAGGLVHPGGAAAALAFLALAATVFQRSQPRQAELDQSVECAIRTLSPVAASMGAAVAALCAEHPQLAAYHRAVTAQGRFLVRGELDAMRDWADRR